jgi:mannosyltransferase OCH1-like enzyme
MIPKIIHQIWIGDLSNMSEAFKKNVEDTKNYCKLYNFKYRLWTDTEIDLLVSLSDTVGIYLKIKTLVEKADFIRLLILKHKGGLYIDLDVDIVKDITPLFNCRDSFVAKEDELKICSAVIGSVKDGNYVNSVLNLVTDELIEIGGMWILRILTEEANRNTFVTIHPTDYFYPYAWHEQDESKMVASANSYLIHRWAKSWWTN